MSQASFPASPRPKRPTSPLVTLIATVIGFALMFLLGIAFGVRGQNIAILGLAVFTGFVGMLPLLLDAIRPPEKRQILMTALAFAYLVFFVVPVFTQYFWADSNQYGIHDLHSHDPRDTVAAQLVALIALLCMIAGFYAPLGRVISRALPKLEPEWSHGTALGVALVMIPIGWAVFLGGQFGLIPRSVGTGFLGIIAMSLFFAIGLLTFVYLRYRSIPALALILLVTPPTMLFNFFTGSKRLFFTPLFMVALAYMLVERRIRMSFAISGIVLLILIYPIAQFHREVVQQGFTLNAVDVLKNPGRVLSQISAFVSGFEVSEYLTYGTQAAGNRFNQLGVLSVIVRDTPSRVPYQGGWTIGYIFISYVPRILWPGKPITTVGQWVTDNYGGGPDVRSNTAPSWAGEFYFNFGYPGVIIGMFLLGIWFRLFQEHFFGSDATIPALLMASAIVYTTARGVGGFLIGPINGPVFFLIPVVFAHLAVRFLSPPARSPTLAGTYASSSIPQGR